MLNKSEFIYIIIVFYALVFTFFGLFGNLVSVTDGNIDLETKSITDNKNLNFFGNMISGISNAPLWLNSIIFAPISITLLFLIITTILGAIIDGGS